jgi:hypothetical protein
MYNQAALDEAEADEAIANDPPDSDYGQVPTVVTPRISGLRNLRRSLPRTYALIQRFLAIVGLETAIASSQNRATAAYLALVAGNTAAAADLEKQDRAMAAYAQHAAALITGRHRIALRAATELRRVTAHLRGREAGRLRAQARGLASTLTSAAAAQADRLAKSALSGLGH